MNSNHDQPATGIMDWGIGGLSVYNILRRQGGAFTYVSDSGFTPYGRTRREDLRRRLREIAAFFENLKITKIYVACNAASCALNDDVEKFGGTELISIIPAGVRAAAAARGRVGVIGGELTIASGIYQRRLAELTGSFCFSAAQPLSGFVEAGELEGPRVKEAIEHVLENLGPIDSLVLACTHYPALAKAFRALRPDLELLDPAAFISGEDGDAVKNDPSNLQMFTSGSIERTRSSALAAFGVSPNSIEGLQFP